MKSGTRLGLFVLLLLVLDQSVKFWIKTRMTLGEEIPVFGDWFKILFVENNGMAFGLQLGKGSGGKLFLSIFRIAAVGVLGWYLCKLIRDKVTGGVVYSFGLIFCGALGNIVDSMFYGILFDASTTSKVAEFLPAGGGYARFLQGKVVDMLYFPLFEGYLPDWLPFWGGDYFIFFRPVFNFADSYITIGVLSLLLFYRKFFKNEASQSPVS